MRIVLVILTFFLTQVCYGQLIDSSAIEFKAKLLTTSRFGIADVDSVFLDIMNQEVTFLSSPSPNTILIKVDFSQRYLLGSLDDQTLWLGNCFYYLAFNVKRNKFYRIGGFDKLDVEDFFNDFETLDYKLINMEYSKSSEINFYCLKKYSDTPVKKRLKNPPCLPICSKELETTLVIPQKEK